MILWTARSNNLTFRLKCRMIGGAVHDQGGEDAGAGGGRVGFLTLSLPSHSPLSYRSTDGGTSPPCGVTGHQP